ncbi:MAG: DUF2075 domain-containing protein [bacterium]|nr:DUF2075 domain-containing protein [bacterium]
MECYSRKLSQVVNEPTDGVIGYLSRLQAEAGFATQYTRQIETWQREVELAQLVARDLIGAIPGATDWHILFEYDIPRRQKRPDIVILADDVVFVIEYKDEAKEVDRAAIWQVYDYALDLRDFHVESRHRAIIPILCPSLFCGENCSYQQEFATPHSVLISGALALSSTILSAYLAEHSEKNSTIDANAWIKSSYQPTLTIIEAAEQLFGNHDVREISHSYADNLTNTTEAIVDFVKRAQSEGERYICFVTGVPGAGKTLTGLNAVHDPRLRQDDRPSAIFLSGNGPLVAIVRSALVNCATTDGRRIPKKQLTREVEAFIQNVHSFLKFHLADSAMVPHEQVVVFDEAQRAWNAAQMKRKWQVDASEPALLLDIMERCPQWSVIVALIGNGQEIHRGEAGLAEWGKALGERSSKWNVAASSAFLNRNDGEMGQCLFAQNVPNNIVSRVDERLHLSVSVRSPRAKRIADWVGCLLDLDCEGAKEQVSQIRDFPLGVTRDINFLRDWLFERSRRDSHHRCGLVASSGGLRLRAHGIEVSTSFTQGYNWDQWFLGDPEDVRSSFSLEVAATEFQCQGLELDWTGVCWADDLVLGPDETWRIRQFRGNRWMNVRDEATRQFVINKYRVLLTRAREGMIIWVPNGSDKDPTRAKALLDKTYRFLLNSGLTALDES